MANFLVEDFKKIFQGKDQILAQIIVINVSVFIVFNILDNFFPLSYWFMLPGNFLGVLTKPHTIFTYMFLHGGLFHILFNMLWLYWLGKIFIEYQGAKRFSAVYFMGGIAGGLLYILFNNMITGFGGLGGTTGLIGASAAVLAVVAAVGTLLPNYTIHLFLLGPVRMKYLAIGAVVISSLLDLSVNTGGKISHLGGAAFGFLYVRSLQRGKDLGEVFYKVSDFFKFLFAKKPKKMKVTYSRAKAGGNKRATNSPSSKSSTTPSVDQAVIDRILDKISKSGYDSLTKEEKSILFKASNN